jgi:hypothetical protein
MLYGYPAEATQENWLHECLTQLVREVHTRVAAGATELAWPDVLPGAYRAVLEKRTGLRDRLVAYEDALRALDANAREQLCIALGQQNEIPELLSNAKDCYRAVDLPSDAVKALERLYRYAFGLLSELCTRDPNAISTEQAIRDRQYDIVFATLPARSCPFCGCERVDPPKRSIVRDPAKREDFDHYLPRSIYPFAGVNLRNLVPMGKKCNQDQKRNVDPVRNSHGGRRRAFDPYLPIPALSVDLTQTDLFGNGGHPHWRLQLGPASSELDTWNDIFDIRQRWIEGVLEQEYNEWLRLFAGEYRRRHSDVVEEPILLEELELAHERACDQGYSDQAFLKAAVFRVLLERYRARDAKLLASLRDLVAMNVAA